jgi:hypothetical protein
MLKNFLLILPVFLLAGCATATFTRLTPNIQPRNANNLYAVETAFDSQQQAMREDSIKAFAVVDGHPYPLHPVPLVQGRWEGLVPVPPSATAVTYRFKFDYLYNNFGSHPKPNSVSSKPFVLKIVD